MGVQLIHFVCKRCGACCRVPGYVRLTEADILALSKELQLAPEVFVNKYTELAPGRTGLVLAGDPQLPCLFLAENGLCRLHAVRPKQCRDYPERWRSAEIEAVCKAVRSGDEPVI